MLDTLAHAVGVERDRAEIPGLEVLVVARPRAIESDGSSWDDPSEERLHDLLADTNLRHRFVTVERVDREPTGQHYMQVYLNDGFSYLVEHREGSADQHFQARVARQPVVIGVAPVARILSDWASGRPGWREALPWARWSPPSA